MTEGNTLKSRGIRRAIESADAMKYLTKMFEAIEKTRGHTPSMEKPVAHKLTEQELNASKSWQKLKKH